MPSNIDLVRGLYAALASGDVPAFLARLDPRIQWNEAEGFPYADRNPYLGPDAIASGIFQRLMSDWDGFHVEVGEIVGSGDVVTMFGRYQGRSAATGKALDAQCAHTWWIHEGRVVRFQQMVDTASVARALS